MFLVKREISPYEDSDIIIGIFESNELAREAKSQYIIKCNNSDKWSDQAYKDVNLEVDITIQNVAEQMDWDYEDSLQTIYVISRYDEAFGQTVRIIDCFMKEDEKAKQYCTQKDQEVDSEQAWAFSYDYEPIKLNQINFDK